MNLMLIFVSLWIGLASSEVPVWPSQSYLTEDFTPPDLAITQTGPTAPGYIFFVPSGPGVSTQSPLIFTNDNELVWHGPPDFTYADFRVQTFNGSPHLTYWRGEFLPEVGQFYGSVRILDASYQEVQTLCPNFNIVTPGVEAECYLDIHESELTSEGTLLATVYNVTQADLTSVGGPKDGWILDGVFFEIDVATGEILFSWSSFDHADQIPLTNSKYPLQVFRETTGSNSTSPWDYFHINSVQKLSDGYLVSGRHFFSIYKVSFDGTIDWILSGDDGGDFSLAPDVYFSWQHRVRMTSPSEVSGDVQRVVFFNNDNSETQTGVNESTALALDLNLHEFTVHKARELFVPSEPIFSNSQGSFLPLVDHHALVGYGQIAKIREFDQNNDLIYEATFGYSNASSLATNYRAYRFEWKGLPISNPKTAFQEGEVYVSWNGATEVKSWRIFAGEACEDVAPIETISKTGFESSYQLGPGNHAFAIVEALDKDGTPLANSSCISTV